MKKYSQEELITIKEKTWMTPDLLAWELHLLTGHQRTVTAVRIKQRKVLGYNAIFQPDDD